MDESIQASVLVFSAAASSRLNLKTDKDVQLQTETEQDFTISNTYYNSMGKRDVAT